MDDRNGGFDRYAHQGQVDAPADTIHGRPVFPVEHAHLIIRGCEPASEVLSHFAAPPQQHDRGAGTHAFLSHSQGLAFPGLVQNFSEYIFDEIRIQAQIPTLVAPLPDEAFFPGRVKNRQMMLLLGFDNPFHFCFSLGQQFHQLPVDAVQPQPRAVELVLVGAVDGRPRCARLV